MRSDLSRRGNLKTKQTKINKTMKKMLRMKKSGICNFLLLFLFTVFLTISLSSCSHVDKKEAPKENQAKKSYEKAIEMADNSNFLMAAERFESVEEEYPFSDYAIKSQVMTAYCYYRANEYNDSIGMIDYFLELNPMHKDAAYMYYLRAMNYYDRVFSVKKNSSNLNQAALALNEVATRYPDTKYGADAKVKLDEVMNNLAAYEMHLGRFYMDMQDYVGALNRFNDVIKKFPETNQSAEAYYRLYEIYTILGMGSEKTKVYDTIERNYKDTVWHDYAKNLESLDKVKKDSNEN